MVYIIILNKSKVCIFMGIFYGHLNSANPQTHLSDPAGGEGVLGAVKLAAPWVDAGVEYDGGENSNINYTAQHKMNNMSAMIMRG